MITLTTEQAQQIEEALVATTLNKDYWLEKCMDSLDTIRAARANFQSETSIENNPADSFKAQEPIGWTASANLTDDGYGHNFTVHSSEPAYGDFVPVYAAPVEQAEQEPVAYFLDVKAGFSSKPLYEQVSDEYKNDADVFPLYAAPVRTKDPTVSEIQEVWNKETNLKITTREIDFARAVIAAYNKGRKK